MCEEPWCESCGEDVIRRESERDESGTANFFSTLRRTPGSEIVSSEKLPHYFNAFAFREMENKICCPDASISEIEPTSTPCVEGLYMKYARIF